MWVVLFYYAFQLGAHCKKMVILYCCISFSLFHIYKVVHIPTFIEVTQQNFPLLDVYLILILCGYLFFMIMYLHYHFGSREMNGNLPVVYDTLYQFVNMNEIFMGCTDTFVMFRRDYEIFTKFSCPWILKISHYSIFSFLCLLYFCLPVIAIQVLICYCYGLLFVEFDCWWLLNLYG